MSEEAPKTGLFTASEAWDEIAKRIEAEDCFINGMCHWIDKLYALKRIDLVTAGEMNAVLEGYRTDHAVTRVYFWNDKVSKENRITFAREVADGREAPPYKGYDESIALSSFTRLCYQIAKLIKIWNEPTYGLCWAVALVDDLEEDDPKYRAQHEDVCRFKSAITKYRADYNIASQYFWYEDIAFNNRMKWIKALATNQPLPAYMGFHEEI